MTQSTARLRIGSRGSPLALVQARTVRARLAVALGVGEEAIELTIIRTSGDAIQDRPLADVGGKGLFTKEIEEALLDGHIDLAVHSAKDMPTVLPAGLLLAACLEREDPRDVFISRKAPSLAELPQGATLGTASLRRQAIAKRARGDLRVVPLRGNVETRLRKRGERGLDGVLLAACGLDRLGIETAIGFRFDVATMIPESGQGIVALQVREGEEPLVAALDHADSSLALAAERACTRRLAGGCSVPVAAHAVRIGEAWRLAGFVGSIDGAVALEEVEEGADPVALGAAAAARLLARGGAALVAAAR
jgi:hydroxymethylbilane synthase